MINQSLSQFIPPNTMHYVTGTWTDAAGQVADTICKHKAAAAETTVVSIPITVPSSANKKTGSKLSSIEIDYEILVAEPTSITPLVNKVTRGADTAVAVVAAQTHTQSPAAAAAKTVDQHRLTLTITTPFYVDNDEFVLVELTFVCAATTQLDILGAVANFKARG